MNRSRSVSQSNSTQRPTSMPRGGLSAAQSNPHTDASERQQSREDRLPNPPAANPHKTTSILLVDRDMSTLSTLSKRLRERGFRVVPAQSATEALQRLVWQYFDLVITSDRIEGVSGYQLAEHLKSLPTIPRGSGVPVLMLHGSSVRSHEASERLQIADASCDIDQPDRIDELVRALLEIA